MQIYPPESWSEVRGIFVGGCVERGEGSSFRARAHAHNIRNDEYFGWICVRSMKRIGRWVANLDSGFELEIVKPSQLLWHEYAHILTPGHWHDDVWRAKMKELGQSVPKQYNKKQREIRR